MQQDGNTRKYASAAAINRMNSLEVSSDSLGHNCPQHCPQVKHDSSRNGEHLELGQPLGIAEVAALLGCSPWTIRQKYLRRGLPHIRASASGRLIFFRDQVIAWVIHQQKEP